MRILSKVGLAALLLGACSAPAQDVITNVTPVNVTPGSFSVIAALSPVEMASNATITVFSDAAGSVSLAGQVGIQYYPLNSGDPAAVNRYTRLLSQAALTRDSIGLGVFYAKVSYCAPNTTYYYRIQATDSGGQSVFWPASGPLPGVTTAVENSFAIQSQELVVTLNDANPPGSVITVSSSNTTAVLAAVVGDGTATNQAFFNLGDLIAISGGTNYLPPGSQLFTATLLGLSTNVSQTYDLIIPATFSVGQGSQVVVGSLPAAVALGQDVLLTGDSGSVPILLNSQSTLVNLSFTLNFAAEYFSALSVVPTSPLLSAAALHVLSPNAVQLVFSAAPGTNLAGSEQIAQLNFITISNQSSAFVPLIPQLLQGTNSDGTIAGSISGQPGRLVIIGPQPLLDTQLVGTTRNLVLYGAPDFGYQIQIASVIGQPGAWTDFARVPMTNLVQVIPNLNRKPAAEYFRAYRMGGDPPALNALQAGNNRSLITYGITGSNYTVQVTSNLSETVVWYPLLSYTMTNSFQYITNLPGPNSTLFYRIQRQ